MLLVVMCKMVVLVGWCGKKLVVLCGCDVEVGQQTEWRYTNIYTNHKLRAGLVVMFRCRLGVTACARVGLRQCPA